MYNSLLSIVMPVSERLLKAEDREVSSHKASQELLDPVRGDRVDRTG